MKSYVFSNTKRPLHFIFWGFGVLTSTTKLQSISSIGPLVMEIHYLGFSSGLTFELRVIPELEWSSMCLDSIWARWKSQVVYLHHQWSDGADTLQFCSTGEYSETLEYEVQRPLGVRENLWFHFILSVLSACCDTDWYTVDPYLFRDWPKFPISSELIYLVKYSNHSRFFAQQRYMYVLCGKNTNTVCNGDSDIKKLL